MSNRRELLTQRVLQVFLDRPDQSLFGLDVARLAHRGISTIYPELLRLEKQGWLRVRWEASPARRLLYQLNPDIPARERVPDGG